MREESEEAFLSLEKVFFRERLWLRTKHIAKSGPR